RHPAPDPNVGRCPLRAFTSRHTLPVLRPGPRHESSHGGSTADRLAADVKPFSWTPTGSRATVLGAFVLPAPRSGDAASTGAHTRRQEMSRGTVLAALAALALGTSSTGWAQQGLTITPVLKSSTT